MDNEEGRTKPRRLPSLTRRNLKADVRIKRMKIILTLIFTAATLFTAGCNAVTSPVPFGLKPVQLSSNSFDNIIWSGEKPDDMRVKVIDPESAKVQVSIRQSEDPENPKWETHTGYFMAGLRQTYLSTACSEIGDSSEGYYFVLVQNEPTKAIVWLPDRMKFRKHVLNGTIKGKVVREDVILDTPTKEFFEYIESGDHGVFFDWKNPMIIKKTRKSEQPDGEPTQEAAQNATP